MAKNLIFTFFLLLAGIELVQGAGKLSWFYVAYVVDMEYWVVDPNDRIRQIDQISQINEITNYPGNEPKTFQTLKVGGLYSFNKLIGLYFELPFYYNRIEPYQSNGQKTSSEDIFALGDTSLGVNLKLFEVMSSTLLVKLPSYPLGGTIKEARATASRTTGFG